MVSASEFRLGVINERTDKPDHALTQFSALHRYLERELTPHGIGPVKLVIADDINEMANHIGNARVDALIEGVMPTLVIKRRSVELEPTLLVWRKGQRQYHTVFFVRSDSGINSLEQLRGKSIAFEAPRSTSAYFVPRAELLAAGIPLGADEERNLPSDSVRYVFADSEINQAYWVHRGRTDAGAFNNGDWDRLPTGIRKDLKIIHRTRPVVRWLFSFTPKVEMSVRQAVVEALLEAHTNDLGRKALQEAARIKQLERLNDQDLENLNYWSTVLEKSQ
ncbi:MAG: phosphate/phosphite/phosphonate ABC transporter substrate-binding protein [Candidatus Thiodiazotropha weberae]|nr:phosphate/phosphite/phosphonate ABC transporter substrate-binding protein [Candidatus Thiodiazotropha weberae]